MKYNTPKLIAKNKKLGNFAAGCPNKEQLICGAIPCERAD